MGAAPALGRLIQASDVDVAGTTGASVVVLSWGFWQRHYGGDPSVLGRSLRAEGVPLTIIGPGFFGTMGMSMLAGRDFGCGALGAVAPERARGTSPYDPVAIAAACGLLLAVTVLASITPAVRAARVDPLAELRRE